ncbi:hypothetical protein SLE2022_089020 [Rubroshorea leprosula]
MAPSFSSSFSSSSSSSKSPPPLQHSPRFTPIQECEREELEDATPSAKRMTPKHIPTPLHDRSKKANARKHHESGAEGSVSCNNCRPHAREKISVVPLDNNGVDKHHSFSMASPNGIFKSIFHSLTSWRSPKPTDTSSAREERWKVAVAELSHKLIQVTRKRDEAVLEASRLKYSMTELEKKLSKLEVYCHNLKSGLDECSGNSPYRIGKGHSFYQAMNQDGGVGFNEKVIDQFLPYDIKVSYSKSPKTLVFSLEALLNKAFFEDFESTGFEKNSVNQILNPIDRCEANYRSFNELHGLTWEEVLNKGTRHFSEEFSRFCDRKMSEIVAMLGWNRAWPEPLLQAFFGASKWVWLVHLLANSAHPALPIFRVDKGVRFDPAYMDDMGGERAKKLVPSMVRIMVTPGFYVDNNVVKCKVLCRYNNNVDNCRIDGKGLTISP